MRRQDPEFTLEEREQIFERDGRRCLRCGKRNITVQHRRAKGMGGLGRKHPKLTCADGITLCLDCNVGAEGVLQTEALNSGWKIPRHSNLDGTSFPVYDKVTGNWWLLDREGNREWINRQMAGSLLAEASAFG